ncbi:MAG TPA: hypothetical protein QGH10_01390, partial [Armatimonadota bacterium]|nr:hypothetical protein [Armatimonadota bacterium]
MRPITSIIIVAAVSRGGIGLADISVGVAHSTDVVARDAEVPIATDVVISAAKGEAESAQIVLRSDRDIGSARLRVSGLPGASLRR